MLFHDNPSKLSTLIDIQILSVADVQNNCRLGITALMFLERLIAMTHVAETNQVISNTIQSNEFSENKQKTFFLNFAIKNYRIF